MAGRAPFRMGSATAEFVPDGYQREYSDGLGACASWLLGGRPLWWHPIEEQPSVVEGRRAMDQSEGDDRYLRG